MTDIHAPWRKLRREFRDLELPEYPRFTEKRGKKITYMLEPDAELMQKLREKGVRAYFVGKDWMAVEVEAC